MRRSPPRAGEFMHRDLIVTPRSGFNETGESLPDAAWLSDAGTQRWCLGATASLSSRYEGVEGTDVSTRKGGKDCAKLGGEMVVVSAARGLESLGPPAASRVVLLHCNFFATRGRPG